MKALLEFDLPAEYSEFRQHMDGPSAFSVLWEVDQRLRSLIKYGQLSELEETRLQEIRDFLHQCCSSNKVNLDA